MHVMVLGLRGFPGVEGGVEKHAEHLYPLLVQAGCKVEVIVRSPYVSHEQRSWNGVIFHRLWAPKIRGVEALLHSVLGVIFAGIKRPDVLHIHAIGPAIVTPLARILGLKVVVTHHGPDYDREKWGGFARWLLRLGEKWGMCYSNQRIVISEVIRELVRDKYQLSSNLIPNGVNLPKIPDSKRALEEFSLEAGRYILQVSRLVPEKRQLDLIEAFAKSELQDWKLVLVGEMDQTDAYCMKVLSAAEATPGVVITNFQSGRALRELYAHAAFFVLPSSHEGLPIVMLEALSYGLLVVASNIPASLEVGLQDRFYFPLGEIQALSEVLKQVADEAPDPCQRQERQAWVKERYNWPCIASQTLEVYKQATMPSSEGS